MSNTPRRTPRSTGTGFEAVKEAPPLVTKRRRRLTDLFVIGKELVFEDGSDNEEPITIWLSKISPLEQKESADRATSARARILAIRKSDDEDAKLQLSVLEEQISDYGITESSEQMIDFLIAPELQQKIVSAEQRISSEGEWAEDEYFKALSESWFDGGMAEKYKEDPEDVEAKRVFSELKRFNDLVLEDVESERENLRHEFAHMSDEKLYSKVLDRTISTEADYAWLAEFSKWQIFFAVRDPDNHDERYFIDRDEIDALDPVVLNRLTAEYQDLTVNPMEEKTKL